MKRKYINTLLGLILLSMDAGEGGVANAPAVDPLDTPCDDIDTSYPILIASNYAMVIKKANRVFTKKQKEAGEGGEGADAAANGGAIKIDWVNRDQQKTRKGDPIAPGEILISEYIPLIATEATEDKKAYTNNDIAKRIAKLKTAVGITDPTITARSVMNDPSGLLVGKEALVKVAIKQATANFPEGNEIKGYVTED